MRIRMTLLVLVFAGVGLTAQEKGGDGGSQLVQQQLAAWSAHDPEKIVSFYTEDVVCEDVAYGAINRGRAELRKFAEGFIEAVPDLKLEAARVYVHNGHGHVEWVLSGTDKGLYKTGKKFSVRGASVFEMRGNRF